MNNQKKQLSEYKCRESLWLKEDSIMYQEQDSSLGFSVIVCQDLTITLRQPSPWNRKLGTRCVVTKRILWVTEAGGKQISCRTPTLFNSLSKGWPLLELVLIPHMLTVYVKGHCLRGSSSVLGLLKSLKSGCHFAAYLIIGLKNLLKVNHCASHVP